MPSSYLSPGLCSTLRGLPDLNISGWAMVTHAYKMDTDGSHVFVCVLWVGGVGVCVCRDLYLIKISEYVVIINHVCMLPYS